MTITLSPAGGWLNCEGQIHSDGPTLVWFFCASHSAAVESLDDVRTLRTQFESRGLRIIGVYSPQYRAEARRRHVVNAVDRLEIDLPVAVDSDHAVYKALGVRSWPGFVLFDASGTNVARLSGPGNLELLRRHIAELVAGSPRPLVQPTLKGYRSASGLRFPTSIFAQTPSVGRDGRVFVSDSGRHRIIEAEWPSLDGQSSVRAIYGGVPGHADGSGEKAHFRAPRGLAFDPQRERLFVADAGNHAIRSINTATGQVSTIFGTGTRGFDRRGGGSGINQLLNTPTDLLLDLDRNRLFIVMSGLNQIWSADLDTMVARAFAGSGELAVRDGDLAGAAFWQPRSITAARDFRSIYCLDADGSALRHICPHERTVRTLVGSAEGFTGDADGPFDQARMCHPVSLTCTDQDAQLVIADAYNDALRIAELNTRTTRRLAPDAWLFEPGGVHYAAALASRTDTPRLFVCDTGNHRVLQFDADLSSPVELRFGGLATDAATDEPERATFNVPMHQPLSVTVGLRDHVGISDDAPVCVRVCEMEGARIGRALAQVSQHGRPGVLPLKITLPAEIVDAATVLSFELSLALEQIGRSVPAYKAWRVRFGSDGGEPRLLAEVKC